MVKVTTTLNPGRTLEVSEAEAKDLERMGLLEQDQPRQGSSMSKTEQPSK